MTAKTAKVVNYTEAQTAEMVAAFEKVRGENQETRDAMVAELAAKFGKTVRSIRAKLSKEKVYVAKEYVSKTGEPVQSKNEWADAIGKVIPSLSENEIDSLTKANKTALEKIFKVLANSKPLE